MDWVTTSTILNDLRDLDNDSAWNRFDERFRPPVVSFAKKAGLSPSDAQDLAQDSLAAFADSLRNGTYDRTKGRLSSWLFGIAYKHILRQRRRLARMEAAAGPNTGTSFWAQLPDKHAATTAWDREWENSLIRQCVDRARQEFPEATFHSFALVVLECRPPRIVAKDLGVSVKTVYDAKYRVLKRVRELRMGFEEVE